MKNKMACLPLFLLANVLACDGLSRRPTPAASPQKSVEERGSGDSVVPPSQETTKEPASGQTSDSNATDSAQKSLLFVAGGSAKIDVYKFDRSNGSATLLKSNATPNLNPTFLAFDVRKNRIIAVNEVSEGGLTSYSFDPESGTLTYLNDARLAGGATHVSLDPTGSFAFGASYGSGHVASFPIGTDGRLGPATSDLIAGTNAHQILTNGDGSKVFVPCLGSNHIAQYDLSANGTLSPANPATLSTLSGGARHMAIHPDQRHAYLMNEYGSNVQALSLTNGNLSLLGEPVSALESPQAGNTGAEIQVHPNGKFVYSSNRGNDSIALFTIENDGRLKFQRTVKAGGSVPRHFSLDANGDWLFAANQGSGTVTIFTVDKESGGITPSATKLNFANAQFVQLVDFR